MTSRETENLIRGFYLGVFKAICGGLAAFLLAGPIVFFIYTGNLIGLGINCGIIFLLVGGFIGAATANSEISSNDKLIKQKPPYAEGYNPPPVMKAERPMPPPSAPKSKHTPPRDRPKVEDVWGKRPRK